MYNGILNVYKEKGYTSHDVVAKLRGILKMKKIGHTGTLDPDACGVLLICLGSATKLCDMLTDKDKTYETVLLLGKTTDTQDIGGTVQKEAPVLVSEETVCRVLEEFVGEYAQVPPMYSAIKVNGKKLYELARQGKEIERKARQVQVYEIEILSMELPRVRMKVRCSKGTYIRTLCHDIGERLGCGGCMEELLRTKVGSFERKDAHMLSKLEELERAKRLEEVLLPVDQALLAYPACVVKNAHHKLLDNGNPFLEAHLLSQAEKEGWLRVYDEDKHFVGVYEYRKEKKAFYPVKIF